VMLAINFRRPSLDFLLARLPNGSLDEDSVPELWFLFCFSLILHASRGSGSVSGTPPEKTYTRDTTFCTATLGNE
jgi:hypothetical protein